MQDAERPNDVHVFVSGDVPFTHPDAYALNDQGTLRIYRWSTRRTPKRFPLAEYAHGTWASYRHLGEQGDEPVDDHRPAPGGRYRDEGELIEAQEERFAEATGVPRGVSHRHFPTEHQPEPEHREAPAPEQAVHPLEREDQLAQRDRDPGHPQNLRPAQVRPPIPPRDFPMPTHRLPARVPTGSEETALLEPVREEQAWRPEPPERKNRATRRARGKAARRLPGGTAWSMLLGIFAAVR